MTTNEPDKPHPCGCVTFWGTTDQQPDRPAIHYRHACASHRRYAHRLGILAK